MDVKNTNYAFIDGNNLYIAITQLGWKLNYKRFRIYLREKHHVEKAYLFLGYLSENKLLYGCLRKYGYDLIFKPIVRGEGGKVKGNVDAELVLQTMIDLKNFDKAIFVTGDGDFYCLVKYLRQLDKLGRIIVPNKYRYSVLLRRAAGPIGFFSFMNDMQKLLEYKNSAQGAE